MNIYTFNYNKSFEWKISLLFIRKWINLHLPSDECTNVITIHAVHTVRMAVIIVIFLIFKSLLHLIFVTYTHIEPTRAGVQKQTDLPSVNPAGATRHACVLTSTCLSLSYLYYLQEQLCSSLSNRKAKLHSNVSHEILSVYSFQFMLCHKQFKNIFMLC